MSSGSGRLGLELDRLLVGSLAMAVAQRRDPDLARLDLLGLRDLEAEDAVLERGVRLVRLEPVREGDGAAEASPADLLEDVAALLGLALLGGPAGDRDGPVLHGYVNVLGLDPRKGGLDREAVGGRRHVEWQCRAVKAPRQPTGWTEVVVEKAIHRLSKGHEVPERRRTAHERHDFAHLHAVRPAQLPDMVKS